MQEKKLAGVFQPARLLLMEQVHEAREDFQSADGALDQAEKALGSQPAVQAGYCRHRACSMAAKGKAAEADSYIERLRAIIKQTPTRSLTCEIHFATGRAWLYLRRFDDALKEEPASVRADAGVREAYLGEKDGGGGRHG